MTYYDLWPDQPVGQTELQTGVKADYNGKVIKSLNDLKFTDVSKSGERGKVSQNGEGRSADGIVKLTTTSGQDAIAKAKAAGEIAGNKDYNGCYNNCSTFAQRVINSVFNINASQPIRPSGMLRALYNDANTVAPNNLYNAALKVKGATSIKGPSSVTAKPYLEYFGKRNRTP
ncbi:hypothetical protein [Flavobacterium sp. BFFFF1]|uniref:hypothetical protein n=1 Tax=Flavobacterium sp. BFFFF1 TaxID=2015557 RepID=UPI0025C6384E|nr:hypothetical protein [Flavobacterium sp. BFFFF1]